VLENAETGRQVLGVIGSIFAIGVMVYTGILLGAARPIAFWSTSMLPLLFLVSATSTGIMSIMLVGSFMGAEAEALHRLTQIDIIFLILEILVLIFFLQATHRVTESRESAMVVLTGAASGMFWFGVALLGILVPLILELFVGGSTVTTIIAAICGIIGGLFLRKVILQGGILAPLKAGIFSFAVPSQS
jgi:polysulfide reductase chain C